MPEASGFKYVYSPKHIEEVLNKVHETGRPDKVTTTYLKDTWLFKNAQYSAVVDVLKDLGFIDASGVPTNLYAEYQNPKNSGTALAKGVKLAYSKLFKAYPSGNTLSTEDLKGYFKQQTGAEKAVLEKIVSTFTKLCKMADFSSIAGDDGQTTFDANQQNILGNNITKNINSGKTGLTININIQLAVPETTDDKIYEKFFEAMKKHLLM